MRQQVQPQVSVVGVCGGSANVPMTVRTRTVSMSRSSSRPLSAASSPGTSATESRAVPGCVAVPISGAGNQVSSTVPSAVTVASPTPAAEVTGFHGTGRLALNPVGLDLRSDPIALTAALVDIPSESGHEARIADEVEAALREQTRAFEVVRHGNAVLARTNLLRPTRVLLAGHLDTVPIADNVPSRREGDELLGCGTVDMKSGDAVFLHLAATLADPARDITLVFYDCEEIEAAANGLGRIERELPDWLRADVAILGEPSGGYIEAGCQGTLRVVVTRRWDPRALCTIVDGRQRNSQTRQGARSAGSATRPARRHRWLYVS